MILRRAPWKIFSKSSISQEKQKPAIENFVDYIRGEAIDPKNDNSSNQLESAEALFKSLGDIEYSITLGDEIKESDILIVDDNVTKLRGSSKALIHARLIMQNSIRW
jgi:hypothetical protein